MRTKQLRRPQLERLIKYLRLLHALSETRVKKVISSRIAEEFELDATQVRKDLAAIGICGAPRVGFDVHEAYTQIMATLGFSQVHQAVLIGVEHMGQALLSYSGFFRCGLSICAAFDMDVSMVGKQVCGLRVHSIQSLPLFLAKNPVRMAILTVQSPAAQKMVNEIVEMGINAIWSFAPTPLVVPKGVLVREEPISLGLSELVYHLANPDGIRISPKKRRPDSGAGNAVSASVCPMPVERPLARSI